MEIRIPTPLENQPYVRRQQPESIIELPIRDRLTAILDALAAQHPAAANRSPNPSGHPSPAWHHRPKPANQACHHEWLHGAFRRVFHCESRPDGPLIPIDAPHEMLAPGIREDHWDRVRISAPQEPLFALGMTSTIHANVSMGVTAHSNDAFRGSVLTLRTINPGMRAYANPGQSGTTSTGGRPGKP